MPSKRSDPFAAPLAEAARSLEAEPGQAERRAREVLSQNAADPRAQLILGAALRRLGAFAGAREVLAILTRAQPNSAHAHLELGLTLEALGDHAGAVAPLARVVTLKPTTIEAWRALAHSMAGLGDLGGAANALRQGLRHAPASSGAAYDLAVMLHRRQDDGEALALAEALVSVSPDDEALQSLLAACAVRVGDYVRATALYRALLERHPEQPDLWLSLGHALRAQGDRTGATHAYRRCVAVSARSGEAYWSLANLKSSHLVASDKEDLRAQLRRSDLDVEDSLHLNYALARLLEEADRFEESFEHYSTGAALCRQTRPYDAEAAAASMAQTRTALVTEVFDWNETPPPPSAPIFIVGLPRSGSTLIEQILASHSAVEGCGELPTMVNIARDLAARSHGDYPASLVRLLPAELIEIGNRYMAESRFYRRRDDARSVDKMPNNFHHLGLIRLALPGAKIIDARRSPMAAGSSLFRQHFAAGHAFSYDLRDIGAYYAAYEDLMMRYDQVMPGAILRVDYETLVNETEAEIRRLLDFCALPFEPGCLAFHTNNRVVRTASSEQVRQPIFTEGLNHWRHYEPWLGPLAKALDQSRGEIVKARGSAP